MPHYGIAHTSGPITDVGVASAIVLDVNPSRAQVIFSNAHATQIIWLQLATTTGVDPVAVVGQGIRISPLLAPFVLEGYTGPIAAIASGAATGLGIVEL